MNILGINSIYHESSACLVCDGQLIAMAEEERFNRRKHGKKPLPENPDELPMRAIHYCLEQAGIDIRQITHAGYSSQPRSRMATAREDDREHTEWQIANIERVPDRLRDLGFRGEFSWLDHHTAHAASAFFPSPFAEAAALTIDGIGDVNSTACYHGVDNQLNLVHDVKMPHSLGFLWELITMLIGFDIYDAAKTMGLSAYGDPKRYAAQFKELVQLKPGGLFEVNPDLCRFYLLDYETPSGYLEGLERLFKVRRREQGEELSQEHKDIAATLQVVTDDAIMHVARHLHELTGSKNLCLAGGVALNCVSNCRVFEDGPFEQLYIQPAAHDAGTAIGCAMYIWNHQLQQPRSEPIASPYLGPAFTDAEIEAALQKNGLKYERRENIAADVARLIGEGQVIGYFQGKMEVGPRALGNRSLLADPRNPEIRQMMNAKVKHREFFRPFAPSVLAEETGNWFQIAKESSAGEYMLMAYPAQEEVIDKIPAVVHTDGTCRIQIVRREINPLYHQVISEFFEQTGVPIVLNTSFNDSEPIVCAPADAIHTFLKTRIDYLAIGDFLVSKQENLEATTEQRPLCPVPLQRTMPAIHEDLDEAFQQKRLSRFRDMHIVTDRLDFEGVDQVLPLYVEQEFFIDQLDRERIAGARALEIGIGSGMLSLAVAKAGAQHVIGLEINPRARIFAGFNIMLNHCEDRIEIRDGHTEIFRPVRGSRFDFIFSNPPFVPTPDVEFHWHSTSGPYGLDIIERMIAGLDEYLTDDGTAEIVTVAPGDAESPCMLTAIAEQHLQGKATFVLNNQPKTFDENIEWLDAAGTITRDQAIEMHRRARRDGVTHLHLCVMQYEKQAGKSMSVVTSDKDYSNWSIPLNGFEQNLFGGK